ncbi:MAG TPA: hypothetical protein IAA29_01970, partial [Candidatus Paenibacillus intestinavium]|nr:hypothetical protein [Candidatus Paenibacillus intestinavium]
MKLFLRYFNSFIIAVLLIGLFPLSASVQVHAAGDDGGGGSGLAVKSLQHEYGYVTAVTGTAVDLAFVNFRAEFIDGTFGT